MPCAVGGALASHAGAILAEEAHLAQAVEADARAGAARGAQPVARAVLRAHTQHDGAVGAVEARIAEALAEGARAVARAVGRAAAERRDDAAVLALEAGLAEAAAVPRARLALAQALAVRRAVVRAAAHHNAAVAAGVPKVALALACQGAAHRGVPGSLVCWVQRGGRGRGSRRGAAGRQGAAWVLTVGAAAVPRAVVDAVRRGDGAVIGPLRGAAEAGLAAAHAVGADAVPRAVEGAELLHHVALAPREPRVAVAAAVEAVAVAVAVAQVGAGALHDRAILATEAHRALAHRVDARRSRRAVTRALGVDRQLPRRLAPVVVELERRGEPQRVARDVLHLDVLLVARART